MTKKMTQESTRLESCNGIAERAFIAEPDRKYIPEGMFKIKLVCDLADESVGVFLAKVDDAIEGAFIDEVPARYRSAWQYYRPYEYEVDEGTGRSTGRIIFEFRRKAQIKLRATGEIRDIDVAVFDSKNRRALPTPHVITGSLVRVWAQLIPIKLISSQQAGVRMDFSCVKVLKMAPPWCPFSDDQIEGGWVAS